MAKNFQYPPPLKGFRPRHPSWSRKLKPNSDQNIEDRKLDITDNRHDAARDDQAKAVGRAAISENEFHDNPPVSRD